MLRDRSDLSPKVLAALESIVAKHHTLGDVVAWGLAEEPPKLVASVVVQDEYTHDVVIDQGAGLYLVYDTP